ncbi:MAG: acyl-CoA dehydratase activase, partial [Thermodesulfobacteriota bacterium]|nr:acyl-CoA dehydratase activase [Thermodesulfobacteriota bacterium]
YKVMEEALEKANLSFDEISYVVATGYGRINVPFADKQVTEITCHAQGVLSIFPNMRTTIDIGGQDAKGIKVSNGKVVDFVMNDKCAAGTGRFLEVIADTLCLKLEEMGELSLKSQNKIKISNTCTIFAEQEIISHIANGVLIEDILAGLHNSIVSRVYLMSQRLKIEPDVVLTGGVAKNIGVVKAMEEHIGHPILVSPEPLLTGAIGAAILGKNLTMKALERGEPLERGGRYLKETTFFT